MTQRRIISITGLNGAGKNALANWLRENYDLQLLEGRDEIFAKAKECGVELKNRLDVNQFANKKRYQFGGSFFIESLLQKMPNPRESAIVSSIRCMGEVKFLQKIPALLIAITADAEIRFNRLVARGSVLDNIDFDQFVENEKHETGENDYQINLPAVLQNAHVTIVNNFETLEELHETLETVLPKHIINYLNGGTP